MKEHYHFIGIGGIGMSALAQILLQKGVKVSGSDASASAVTQQLQSYGAEISIGHAASNLNHPTAVVLSSAVKDENPEVLQAKSRGVPLLHRSDLLQRLMQNYQALLVTGTHGKTTTSSLLAHLLVDAGLDPAYAVGGIISSLNSNGSHGKGSYFVAEADESDGSFLKYSPYGAIITNIDNDHLDYWHTLPELIAGYEAFINHVKSSRHLFWCGDDEILCSLNPKGISYGFDEKNALHIKNFRQEGWKNIFDMRFHGIEYAEIEIPLIGGHNVLNAAAVFGLGLQIQIPETKIRKAFARFKGVSRRTEWKGESRGISIFDDYGHHPTEIYATLRAIKQAVGDRNLVVAFQPHRYSRTRDCLREFGPAFERADQLILTDIYAAGEDPIPGITAEVLLADLQQHAGLDVRYVPKAELAKVLASRLQPEDVLVTMGAGDITTVGPAVLKLLQA